MKANIKSPGGNLAWQEKMRSCY